MGVSRQALIITALALAACSGEVSRDATGSTPESADAAATAVPSFGDAGPTMAIPVACLRCAANDACGGPQYACVASKGAPFCAAGCSKDGFCNAEQTCTWVVDPAGERWRACLSSGDPCGEPLATPRRAVRTR